MEIEEVKQIPKTKKKESVKQTTFLKKLDSETFKALSALKEKANKKSIGRSVKDCEIIFAALRLIGPEQIKELQAQTYSERDRLELAYQEYQRINGKTSMEQFINVLLNAAPMAKTN